MQKNFLNLDLVLNAHRYLSWAEIDELKESILMLCASKGYDTEKAIATQSCKYNGEEEFLEQEEMEI